MTAELKPIDEARLLERMRAAFAEIDAGKSAAEAFHDFAHHAIYAACQAVGLEHGGMIVSHRELMAEQLPQLRASGMSEGLLFAAAMEIAFSAADILLKASKHITKEN